MSDSVSQQIEQVVKNNDVVLFMKGTPDFPQCGFSQRVAAILNSYEIPFSAVNVLLSNDVREGIKAYSDWPTIPQLYVNAEFVGGCDIVSEMHDGGELEELLAPYKK
ncbi:Grx4 family monothiol glutaredoxin [Mariprofundus sp. EBB-1]|uniref:Grx4 family monothiol glutaredoxin n=1 Tax=Mariprofundus sp. EBB-1 TaxID=2650971 RepID=UPI000EF1CD8A|nr:Grx4 family monothiol glutaredoxin [Mariprofundus sp. EBB-1]RLL54048.1 Grx4 family monothiol glutaredoxin [Mariprofundus sp. EBB-1]